ncbi:MAG TPA: SAM-dependent methyltransferase [Bacteroidales bacterium]|nr:SAM-dependent methyltransferase [Bacteroidales bacterium]
MAGTLYLIPVTLGNPDFGRSIPVYVTDIARSLRFFVVEDTRSARRFLRLIDKNFPIDETDFRELNEHSSPVDTASLITPLLEGHDMGLMSEAGLPCIADPGSLLVRQAHRSGIKVVPLPGPSSILLSVIASGLNGQNFVFHGYLPQKANERLERIKEIEKKALTGQSQVFMETPYRAAKMMETLLSGCRPDTSLCVAINITLETEEISTMKISEWRKQPPDLDGKLVVFVLGQ